MQKQSEVNKLSFPCQMTPDRVNDFPLQANHKVGVPTTRYKKKLIPYYQIVIS